MARCESVVDCQFVWAGYTRGRPKMAGYISEQRYTS